MFASGASVIVNRQNFEWNKTTFSEKFKSCVLTTEFISMWKKLTIMDSTEKYALVRSEESSTDNTCSSSSSSCAGTKHQSSFSTGATSSDLGLPASKRVASEKQTEHCSAIDDVIHSKHIGW